MRALLVCLAVVSIAATACAQTQAKLEILVSQQRYLIAHEVREPGNGYTGADGFYDLVVPNIAFVNGGPGDITVDSAWIEARSGARPLERRYIQKEEVRKALDTYKVYASQHFPLALNVEFASDTIVPRGISVGSSASEIKTHSAIIATDNYIVCQDAPTAIAIGLKGHDRSGHSVLAESEFPVTERAAKNSYIFPLERGNWYVVGFPGVESHHRFTQSTEYAVDITRVDSNGAWHSGTGRKWTDWYAYGATVIAAADGQVVRVESNSDLDPAVWMRGDNETPEDYDNRLGERQLKRFLAPGADPFEVAGGNYVVIAHANGEYSHYAHLACGSVRVKVGDNVLQGQPIARVGGTGEAPEVHLHFEVSDLIDDKRFAMHTFPVRFSNVGRPQNARESDEPGYFVRVH